MVDLPDWFPDWLVDLVLGHLPEGDPDAMRAAAEYWRSSANALAELGADIDEVVQHGKDLGISGDYIDEVRDWYRQCAVDARELCKDHEDRAKQLEEGALQIEFQQYVVKSIAFVLIGQILFDLTRPHPATVLVMMQRRLAAREAMVLSLRNLVTMLRLLNAKFAVAYPRLALVVKGAVMGTALGGGTQAYAMGRQIAEGNRDEMDWKQVGIGAGAGLSSGIVGAALGGAIARKVMGSSARSTSPVSWKARQIAAVVAAGAISGPPAAYAGAKTMEWLSGVELTDKEMAAMIWTGFGSGVASSIGAAIRAGRTPPPGSAHAGAPADGSGSGTPRFAEPPPRLRSPLTGADDGHTARPRDLSPEAQINDLGRELAGRMRTEDLPPGPHRDLVAAFVDSQNTSSGPRSFRESSITEFQQRADAHYRQQLAEMGIGQSPAPRSDGDAPGIPPGQRNSPDSPGSGGSGPERRPPVPSGGSGPEHGNVTGVRESAPPPRSVSTVSGTSDGAGTPNTAAQNNIRGGAESSQPNRGSAVSASPEGTGRVSAPEVTTPPPSTGDPGQVRATPDTGGGESGPTSVTADAPASAPDAPIAPESPAMTGDSVAPTGRDSAEPIADNGARPASPDDGSSSFGYAREDGESLGNCAPESVSYMKEITGYDGINTSLLDNSQTPLRGVEVEQWAQALNGHWRTFDSPQALVDYVANNNVKVAGAVQFKDGAGAHAATFSRNSVGRVEIHEQKGNIVREISGDLVVEWTVDAQGKRIGAPRIDIQDNAVQNWLSDIAPRVKETLGVVFSESAPDSGRWRPQLELAPGEAPKPKADWDPLKGTALLERDASARDAMDEAAPVNQEQFEAAFQRDLERLGVTTADEPEGPTAAAPRSIDAGATTTETVSRSTDADLTAHDTGAQPSRDVDARTTRDVGASRSLDTEANTGRDGTQASRDTGTEPPGNTATQTPRDTGTPASREPGTQTPRDTATPAAHESGGQAPRDPGTQSSRDTAAQTTRPSGAAEPAPNPRPATTSSRIADTPTEQTVASAHPSSPPASPASPEATAAPAQSRTPDATGAATPKPTPETASATLGSDTATARSTAPDASTGSEPVPGTPPPEAMSPAAAPSVSPSLSSAAESPSAATTSKSESSATTTSTSASSASTSPAAAEQVSASSPELSAASSAASAPTATPTTASAPVSTTSTSSSPTTAGTSSRTAAAATSSATAAAASSPTAASASAPNLSGPPGPDTHEPSRAASPPTAQNPAARSVDPSAGRAAALPDAADTTALSAPDRQPEASTATPLPATNRTPADDDLPAEPEEFIPPKPSTVEFPTGTDATTPRIPGFPLGDPPEEFKLPPPAIYTNPAFPIPPEEDTRNRTPIVPRPRENGSLDSWSNRPRFTPDGTQEEHDPTSPLTPEPAVGPEVTPIPRPPATQSTSLDASPTTVPMDAGLGRKYPTDVDEKAPGAPGTPGGRPGLNPDSLEYLDSPGVETTQGGVSGATLAPPPPPKIETRRPVLSTPGTRHNIRGTNPFPFAPAEDPWWEEVDLVQHAKDLAAAIAEHNAELDDIANDAEEPTVDNTLHRFAESGADYRRLAEQQILKRDKEDRNSVAEQVDNLITGMKARHNHDVLTNKKLFERVEKLYFQREDLDLQPQTKDYLQRLYQDFRHAGVRSAAEEQSALASVDAKLADLVDEYQNNLVQAIAHAARNGLAGLDPEQAAKAADAAAGMIEYILDLPNRSSENQQPFWSFADDGATAQLLYQAAKRLGAGGAYDNTNNTVELLRLLADRAQIVGEPHDPNHVPAYTPISPEQRFAILSRLIPAGAEDITPERLMSTMARAANDLLAALSEFANTTAESAAHHLEAAAFTFDRADRIARYLLQSDEYARRYPHVDHIAFTLSNVRSQLLDGIRAKLAEPGLDTTATEYLERLLRKWQPAPALPAADPTPDTPRRPGANTSPPTSYPGLMYGAVDTGRTSHDGMDVRPRTPFAKKVGPPDGGMAFHTPPGREPGVGKGADNVAKRKQQSSDTPPVRSDKPQLSAQLQTELVKAALPNSLADTVSAVGWHETLTTGLRRIVLDETISAGQKLAPARTFADELARKSRVKISTETVTRAYRELADAGYLVSRGKAGTTVTSKDHWPKQAPADTSVPLPADEQAGLIEASLPGSLADTAARTSWQAALADGLRQAILDGYPPEGQRLTPIEKLAEELGISSESVRRAYNQLDDEGYLQVRHPVSTTVASRDRWPSVAPGTEAPLSAAETLTILTGEPSPGSLADTAADIGWHATLTPLLRQMILDGHVGQGQRMTPAKELAEALGISKDTVRRVFRSLAGDGYLVIKPSSGTRVADAGQWPNSPETVQESPAAVQASAVLRDLLGPNEYHSLGAEPDSGVQMSHETAVALRDYAVEHGELRIGGSRNVYKISGFAVQIMSRPDNVLDHVTWADEAAIIEAAARKMGGLPRILYVGDDFRIDRDAGEPIADFFSDPVIMQKLTTIITDFHNLPLSDFGDIPQHLRSGTLADFIRIHAAHAEQVFQEFGERSVAINAVRQAFGFGPRLTDALEQALTDFVESPIEPWVPLHMDVTPNNVLVDAHGNVTLIDFQYAGPGPRAVDGLIALHRNGMPVLESATLTSPSTARFILTVLPMLDTFRASNDTIRMVELAQAGELDDRRARMLASNVQLALTGAFTAAGLPHKWMSIEDMIALVRSAVDGAPDADRTGSHRTADGQTTAPQPARTISPSSSSYPGSMSGALDTGRGEYDDPGARPHIPFSKGGPAEGYMAFRNPPGGEPGDGKGKAGRSTNPATAPSKPTFDVADPSTPTDAYPGWLDPVEVVVVRFDGDRFVGPDGRRYNTRTRGGDTFLMDLHGNFVTTPNVSGEHPHLYNSHHRGSSIYSAFGYWRIIDGRLDLVGPFSGLFKAASHDPKHLAYLRYALSEHVDLSRVDFAMLEEIQGLLWLDGAEIPANHSAAEIVPEAGSIVSRNGLERRLEKILNGAGDGFWIKVVDFTIPADGGLHIDIALNAVRGESGQVVLDMSPAGEAPTASLRDFDPGPEPARTHPILRQLYKRLTPWLEDSGFSWTPATEQLLAETPSRPGATTPATEPPSTTETSTHPGGSIATDPPAPTSEPVQAQQTTPGGATPADRGRSLRVATWNIAGGRVMRSSDDHAVSSDDHAAPEDGNSPFPLEQYDHIDVAYFAEQIRQADLDVVAIQESEAGAGGTTAQELAALLGYPYVYETVMCPSHMDPSQTKMLSLAVISRIPIDAAEGHLLPVTTLELRIGGRPVAPHDRFAQVVEIGGVTIINTHPTPLGVFGYNYEHGDGAVHAEEIGQMLRALATGPVVIASDLNTDRPQTAYGAIFDEIGLSPVIAADARTVPIWDGAPDLILASREFDIAESSITQTNTDHWLVHADLTAVDQQVVDSLTTTRGNEAPPPLTRIDISVKPDMLDGAKARDVVAGTLAGSPLEPQTAAAAEMLEALLSTADGPAVVRTTRGGQADAQWVAIEVIDQSRVAPVRDKADPDTGVVTPTETGRLLELLDEKSRTWGIELFENGDRSRRFTLATPAVPDGPLPPLGDPAVDLSFSREEVFPGGGAVRRAFVELLDRNGWSEGQREDIRLTVTEVFANISRYAKEGGAQVRAWMSEDGDEMVVHISDTSRVVPGWKLSEVGAPMDDADTTPLDRADPEAEARLLAMIDIDTLLAGDGDPTGLNSVLADGTHERGGDIIMKLATSFGYELEAYGAPGKSIFMKFRMDPPEQTGPASDDRSPTTPAPAEGPKPNPKNIPDDVPNSDIASHSDISRAPGHVPPEYLAGATDVGHLDSATGQRPIAGETSSKPNGIPKSSGGGGQAPGPVVPFHDAGPAGSRYENPLAPERHRLVGGGRPQLGPDGYTPLVFNRFNRFPDPTSDNNDDTGRDPKSLESKSAPTTPAAAVPNDSGVEPAADREKITNLWKLMRTDHKVGMRFSSEFLNATGISIVQTAIDQWYMTNSGPAVASAVSALITVPAFVGAPIAGYLTDHFSPRKLMWGSAFVGASTSAASTIALATGTPYTIPILLGSTFVAAGASVVYGSSSAKVLNAMAGDAQHGLSRYNNLKQNIPRIVGRGAAPSLLAVGPWLAPLINLGTNVANLTTMSGIPDIPTTPRKNSFRKQILDAVVVGPRTIYGNPMLRSINNAHTLTNLYLGMQGSQFTYLLVNSGMSATQMGLVATLVPSGAVIGNVIPTKLMDKFRVKTLSTMRLAGLAGTAMVPAITSDPLPASAAFAAGWALIGATSIPVSTYGRRKTPGAVLGQANAVRNMTMTGSVALGGLASGGALELMGQGPAATALAAGAGAVGAWTVLQRLFGRNKARELLDCISQTTRATQELGLLHGTTPKKRRNNPKHLAEAISTQLVELPHTGEPEATISAYLDKITDPTNPVDTTVILYDYGKKKGMHSTVATNIGNDALLIFDTNIQDPTNTDPDDPDRIPRVRTRDEYELPYADDIEKIYIAELTIDEDNNLTNLHPIDPDQPAPREKGKIKGRPAGDDGEAIDPTVASLLEILDEQRIRSARNGISLDFANKAVPPSDTSRLVEVRGLLDELLDHTKHPSDTEPQRFRLLSHLFHAVEARHATPAPERQPINDRINYLRETLRSSGGQEPRTGNAEHGATHPVRVLFDSTKASTNYASRLQYGREIWEEVVPQLTDAEVAAMRPYTIDPFWHESIVQLKEALRGGYELTPELARTLAATNAVLARRPLPEPMVMSISLSAELVDMANNPIVPGAEFRLPDLTLAMTGVTPPVLGDRFKVVLTVPAGTPSFPLFVLPSAPATFPLQLLPNGLSIRIDRTRDMGEGHWLLHATVVAGPGTQVGDNAGSPWAAVDVTPAPDPVAVFPPLPPEPPRTKAQPEHSIASSESNAPQPSPQSSTQPPLPTPSDPGLGAVIAGLEPQPAFNAASSRLPAAPGDHSTQAAGPIAAVSDIGVGPEHGGRDSNEDAFGFVTVTVDGAPVQLAVVADGVGGSPRGGEAAQAAVRAAIASMSAASAELGSTGQFDPLRVVRRGMSAARAAVAELAETPGQPNSPDSTAALAVMQSGNLVIDSAGDTRVYWLPVDGGTPKQLSVDDTIVPKLIASGMPEGEALQLSYAGQTTRSLGRPLPDDAQSHATKIPVEGRGYVLIATDGVWHDTYQAHALAAIVEQAHQQSPGDHRAVAAALNEHAHTTGNHDNMTNLLIWHEPAAATPDQPSPQADPRQGFMQSADPSPHAQPGRGTSGGTATTPGPEVSYQPAHGFNPLASERTSRLSTPSRRLGPDGYSPGVFNRFNKFPDPTPEGDPDTRSDQPASRTQQAETTADQARSNSSVQEKAVTPEQFDIGQSHTRETEPPLGAAGDGVRVFRILADPGESGDVWVAPGVWGRRAAGILTRNIDDAGIESFLLAQEGTTGKGKWQLPGGALDSAELPGNGAAREMSEELGVGQDYLDTLVYRGTHVFDGPGVWRYYNLAADAPSRIDPVVDGQEILAARWVTRDELLRMANDGELHSALARELPDILAQFDKPIGMGDRIPGRDLIGALDYQTINAAINPDEHRDDGLALIWRDQGFDGLPTIAGADGLDAVIEAGGVELFRGLAEPSYVEMFRSGSHFPGKGVHGNGTYAATTRNVADGYGGGDAGGGLVRMALRPDAKKIDLATLRKQQAAALASIERKLRWTPWPWRNAARREELQHRREVLRDLGRFAAARGYDAYEIGQYGYWVVLNRTAVVVEGLTSSEVAAAQAGTAGDRPDGEVSLRDVISSVNPRGALDRRSSALLAEIKIIAFGVSAETIEQTRWAVPDGPVDTHYSTEFLDYRHADALERILLQGENLARGILRYQPRDGGDQHLLNVFHDHGRVRYFDAHADEEVTESIRPYLNALGRFEFLRTDEQALRQLLPSTSLGPDADIDPIGEMSFRLDADEVLLPSILPDTVVGVGFFGAEGRSRPLGTADPDGDLCAYIGLQTLGVAPDYPPVERPVGSPLWGEDVVGDIAVVVDETRAAIYRAAVVARHTDAAAIGMAASVAREPWQVESTAESAVSRMLANLPDLIPDPRFTDITTYLDGDTFRADVRDATRGTRLSVTGTIAERNGIVVALVVVADPTELTLPEPGEQTPHDSGPNVPLAGTVAVRAAELTRAEGYVADRFDPAKLDMVRTALAEELADHNLTLEELVEQGKDPGKALWPDAARHLREVKERLDDLLDVVLSGAAPTALPELVESLIANLDAAAEWRAALLEMMRIAGVGPLIGFPTVTQIDAALRQSEDAALSAAADRYRRADMALDATMSRLAARPDPLLDKVRGVNPGRGETNCAEVAVVTDLALAGRQDYVAAPAPPTTLGWPDGEAPARQSYFAGYYSGEFRAVRSMGDIDAELLAAEQTGSTSARGLVIYGQRDADGANASSHVLNVVVDDGAVRYFDGQTGRDRTYFMRLLEQRIAADSGRTTFFVDFLRTDGRFTDAAPHRRHTENTGGSAADRQQVPLGQSEDELDDRIRSGTSEAAPAAVGNGNSDAIAAPDGARRFGDRLWAAAVQRHRNLESAANPFAGVGWSIIRAALADLSQERRRIAELRYLRGLSSRDAASRLAKPMDYVELVEQDTVRLLVHSLATALGVPQPALTEEPDAFDEIIPEDRPTADGGPAFRPGMDQLPPRETPEYLALRAAIEARLPERVLPFLGGDLPRLLEVLAELPADRAEYLELRVLRGWSHADTQSALGLSNQTQMKTMRRLAAKDLVTALRVSWVKSLVPPDGYARTIVEFRLGIDELPRVGSPEYLELLFTIETRLPEPVRTAMAGDLGRLLDAIGTLSGKHRRWAQARYLSGQDMAQAMSDMDIRSKATAKVIRGDVQDYLVVALSEPDPVPALSEWVGSLPPAGSPEYARLAAEVHARLPQDIAELANGDLTRLAEVVGNLSPQRQAYSVLVLLYGEPHESAWRRLSTTRRVVLQVRSKTFALLRAGLREEHPADRTIPQAGGAQPPSPRGGGSGAQRRGSKDFGSELTFVNQTPWLGYHHNPNNGAEWSTSDNPPTDSPRTFADLEDWVAAMDPETARQLMTDLRAVAEQHAAEFRRGEPPQVDEVIESARELNVLLHKRTADLMAKAPAPRGEFPGAAVAEELANQVADLIPEAEELAETANAVYHIVGMSALEVPGRPLPEWAGNNPHAVLSALHHFPQHLQWMAHEFRRGVSLARIPEAMRAALPERTTEMFWDSVEFGLQKASDLKKHLLAGDITTNWAAEVDGFLVSRLGTDFEPDVVAAHRSLGQGMTAFARAGGYRDREFAAAAAPYVRDLLSLVRYQLTRTRDSAAAVGMLAELDYTLNVIAQRIPESDAAWDAAQTISRLHSSLSNAQESLTEYIVSMHTREESLRILALDAEFADTFDATLRDLAELAEHHREPEVPDRVHDGSSDSSRPPARVPAIVSVERDELTDLFTAYGNDNSSELTWTGANSTYSVELPDGRTLWIFS
ncbi:GntR family transcriptional regulator, partial [Nocardia cyriacigeorgica]|uniref:GntR family transcriptional regulator n=1 Tax=Nocardia cyriacigeorgica TaxID=135487 RepID=UPI0024542F01